MPFGELRLPEQQTGNHEKCSLYTTDGRHGGIVAPLSVILNISERGRGVQYDRNIFRINAVYSIPILHYKERLSPFYLLASNSVRLP